MNLKNKEVLTSLTKSHDGKFEVKAKQQDVTRKMPSLYTKNYLTFMVETAEGDVLKEFSGAVNAGKALPGDYVVATEEGCELVNRIDHPPLVGVIEFTSKIRYGFTVRGVPLYLFTPYNEAYPPMLISSKDTNTENYIAVATFEHWDESTFPRGGLTQILGPCGSIETEKKAVTLQYSPWSWSKRMIEELVYPSKEGRYVLDKPTINIDPQGCQDIDDVVSLWQEDGIWNLAISIADVAAFMKLNTFLEFAGKIGQTLYSANGRVIRPMFPSRFSEDAFSLLPGEERFCVTLFAKWDGEQLYGFEWKETLVRNWSSYTYENCLGATEFDISVLKQIVKSLNYDWTDTHKWIEALMILYNTKAAELLKLRYAGLLRVHDEPAKERLATMNALGLPASELAYPAATYAITSTVGGHWGLGKAAYCHASSPIRRYADIVNQMVIKTVILADQDTYRHYALLLNRLEKGSKAYERDCNFIECVLGNPGIPVHGIVVEAELGKKTTIYIGAWKRMIRCICTSDAKPGQNVVVGFYAKTGRCWKRKVVYRVENI